MGLSLKWSDDDDDEDDDEDEDDENALKSCDSSSPLHSFGTARNPMGDFLAITTKIFWRCPTVENNGGMRYLRYLQYYLRYLR